MKHIPLTQGQVAMIDDDDFDRVFPFKWYAKKSRLGFYAGRGRSPAISLHRFIMDAGPGTFVDHINGDTLDNRKCNLRFCTSAENARNSRKYSTNGSGVKGVSFMPKKKRWSAKITYNYKKYFLGYYLTMEEAYEAYKVKARELFGDFARFE